MSGIASLLAVSSHEIVEAVGWSLVHTLWQFVLLWAASRWILLVGSRWNAQTRYAILVGCLLFIVAIPVLQVANHFGPANATRAWTSNRRTIASNPITAASPGNAHKVAPMQQMGTGTNVVPDRQQLRSEAVTVGQGVPIPHRPNILGQLRVIVIKQTAAMRAALRPWLGTIVAWWIAGVVALSFRPLVGWCTLRKLARQGDGPVSAEIQDQMVKLSSRLGLRATVRVLSSTMATAPLVVGYLRPTILLPVCLIAHVSPRQLEAILAHELAHIRRHDFLVNLLQITLETVFFYHPAVWWISHQLRVEREHACDDMAIALTNQRAEYGRALLVVEELRSDAVSSATSLWSLAASDGSLIARVRRIAGLHPPPGPGRFSASVGTVAAMLVFVVVLGFGMTQHSPPPALAQENELNNAHDDAEVHEPSVVDDSASEDYHPNLTVGGLESLSIPQIAQRIADEGNDWKLHHVDDEPSVRVAGNQGYRIRLRRTWREYKELPQQRASATETGPFEERQSFWEFVLFPHQDGTTSRPTIGDWRSRIAWMDGHSPYYTRDVYLGVAHGYAWFSRSTLFGQEFVRRKLHLQGGDDRIPLLIEGLMVDDVGTMTANSCKHLLAYFGNACLPKIKQAIVDNADELALWRIIGSVVYIRTPEATQLLTELYHSDDNRRREAAAYVLVHPPYRRAAKSAYLDMLRNNDRIDRLTSACEAAVAYGWEDAMPILDQRMTKPNSVRELLQFIVTRRSLEAKPLAQELTEAGRTLMQAGFHAADQRQGEANQAVATARKLLTTSTEDLPVTLISLTLLEFTTKGDSEPVRRIGREILLSRPRTSTLQILYRLSRQLPPDRQGSVREALQLLRDQPATPGANRIDIDKLIATAGLPLDGGEIDYSRMPGLFEEKPRGSGSYEMVAGIVVFQDVPSDFGITSLAGSVMYDPSKNVYYIQRDPLGSSTLHYHGPFPGDPRRILANAGD